jgi:hypothetical protein
VTRSSPQMPRHALPALLAAVVLAVTALTPAAAGAHAMPTSALVLQRGDHAVTGTVQVPVGRLEFALGRRSISRAQARAYVARHIGATGPDGARWAVTLGAAAFKDINSVGYYIMSVRLAPPDGGRPAGTFHITYDAVLATLVTHKALLIVGGHEVGVFDWDHHALAVPSHATSWLHTAWASAGMGIDHVRTGADHLLFLLTLLLPAPLLARSRRAAAVRVVHVVSAFAVGHSTTLILAGFGVIHVPERPIEALIALSIMAAALNAMFPTRRRGEVAIATGFGLVHGLAFASALSALGLHGGALVSSLLGFNLGIEATQLMVVALVLPSLLVLAETRYYRPFRLTLAAAALACATSWLLERTSVTHGDPFLPATDWLIANPLTAAAAVAVLAGAARVACRDNPTSPGRAPEAEGAALARY